MTVEEKIAELRKFQVFKPYSVLMRALALIEAQRAFHWADRDYEHANLVDGSQIEDFYEGYRRRYYKAASDLDRAERAFTEGE